MIGRNILILWWCGQACYKLVYAFYHRFSYGFIVGHGLVHEDKEEVHLLLCWYGLVQGMLMQPPCLGHEPAYAVPVHGAFELLLGYRKTYLNGSCLLCDRAGQQCINASYGKNRKRFP